MLNRIQNKILLLTFAVAFVSGCSKDPLYDFFIGGQPNFIGDHKFVPGLNIFGVLRPDYLQSVPLSFVHVEKAIPAISNVDGTFSVDSVSVVLYKIEHNTVVDSIILKYNNPNKLFPLPEFRPDKFIPQAGEQYKIKCNAGDLPELTAETTVPYVPQLEGDTILKTNNKLQFSIVRDSSAAMYDIYVIINGTVNTKRVVSNQSGNTFVEIDAEEIIPPGTQLTIFAYDTKLSEYFAAANLSFKPNTYRPPFSNVNNGYGCFGSMNILKITLK